MIDKTGKLGRKVKHSKESSDLVLQLYFVKELSVRKAAEEARVSKSWAGKVIKKHRATIAERNMGIATGFNITFFISRLVTNGIYVFYEVANLRFPESLDDLPSFITLKNITLLLAVNDVFWRLCKKSDDTATITSRYKQTVDLKALIGTSHDRGRTCTMRYGQ
ncbi:uncharacterized protein BX664DRAFT_320746 [Halteromyces radiatus]|uniref:uncharacterized protein n=1 Tax=Halteromyces radiatus TaxID=101107 RepID=UPI00221E3F8C|nr:uncharacterized protein BX664DRAFT_320746 [Halteromyces radiatus]KAI8099236.1 hypothetical protein BX664DRAFT_320746 [Halteromyces radiatus]